MIVNSLSIYRNVRPTEKKHQKHHIFMVGAWEKWGDFAGVF